MLSLSNAFDVKDMKDFLKKINNFLKFKKIKVLNYFLNQKLMEFQQH